MPDKKFLKHRHLQKLLSDYYAENGQRLSFMEGLKKIDSSHFHTSLPNNQKQVPQNYLNVEAFLDAIGDTYINVDKVLSDFGYFLHKENFIFPNSKDIYAIKPLNWVDGSQMHRHDYFELIHVYKGFCQLRFEDETLDLNEGDLLILSPFSLHELLIQGEDIIIVTAIRSSTFTVMFGNTFIYQDAISMFLRNSLNHSKEPNYINFSTKNSGEICRIIQNVFFESHSSDPYSNRLMINLINILFITLLRHTPPSHMMIRSRTSEEDLFDGGLLIQYIKKHYNSITLTELSQVFHYSEAYLSGLIYKHMGNSFSSIRRDIRLKKAVAYLTETSLSITDIAMMIGYQSADHFTRIFKKKYGVSPLGYRKSSADKVYGHNDKKETGHPNN